MRQVGAMGPINVSLLTYDREGSIALSKEKLCGPVDIDIVSLRSFYEDQGAAAARAFRKFLDIWDAPEFQETLSPGACLAFTPLNVIPVDLIQGFLAGIYSTGGSISGQMEMAAAVVWTLGGGIDQYVSNNLASEDHLPGMILDVAATQTLNSIHRILRDLVTRESLTLFRLRPVFEYCPGTGGGGMESIPGLITLTRADVELGLSAGKGVMRPMRSRCSVFSLAEGQPGAELEDRRCVPCQGKRCLYRQIGGCQFFR